jgi:hypothetical protein
MKEQPTMTPQSTNKVIVVGRLGTIRRGGQERSYATARNAIGGYEREFAVQFVTAFGYSFSLQLSVPAHIAGAELLDPPIVGRPIVVEGVLKRSQYYDGRYALNDTDLCGCAKRRFP